MLYYEDSSSKQDAEWFGSCNNISLNKGKIKCSILNQ